MSLIINMLKDLDKRENSRPEIPSMVTSHQSYQTSKFDLNKKILVACIALLFAFLMIYVFSHKRSSHSIIPVPNEIAAVKTPSDLDKVVNPLFTPVEINGVSFEAKDDSTEISFMLTHDALYRIVSSDNDKKITLFIDNANMKSDLPTLIGAEIGIQNITSISANGNTKFTIILKPGAYLRSVNLNKDAKNPELVVSIGNAKLLPEEDIVGTNNIKSPAMQTIIMDKYQKAVRLAEAGNTQEAIANLSKILINYPDYNDVRVSLAAITLKSGNPVQARTIIDDGLALEPDYLPLIELKARVLTSEGKTKEALMVLQSEQPLIADEPGYHAFIAALFNRNNNYKLAADIYQKLVHINPHEGSWWFGLGVSLDKLGQNKEAIFAYTKAATEGRLNAQASAFLQTRLNSLQDATHATE